MIDDLKYIHERDPQDALGIVEKQWQQLKHKFPINWDAPRDIDSITIAGMGGSALAASLINTWPHPKVNLSIVRDYELPPSVSNKSLFIASSYSGNTEETLAATNAAEELGCPIVVIASGGELEKLATAKNLAFYRLPPNIQPRMAVFYSLAAILQILSLAGLIDQNKIDELDQSADWLGEQLTSWRPDVATHNNLAKQIALELVGRSIVVYSGPKLFPVAYKWKINFNENAKQIAWTNEYPEFNHNEMLGWTKQPVDKPYSVIEIRSNLEHPRVQKRFMVSERLLSGLRPAPIVVSPQGDSLLKQLLWAITLGDFCSVYLAILNNVNPIPVELVEKFKKELG